MQTKPTIRDAWDYLRAQGMIGRVPVAEQLEAMRTDPLEIKREYFAQQLANAVLYVAKVRA